MRRSTLGALAAVAAVVTTAQPAFADTFAAGSYIIPMDTTYQDKGMLRSFGLVYDLLRHNIPIRWVIRVGKTYPGVDFEATCRDFKTSTLLAKHGYRGGPWVIDSADAAAAQPLIQAFQTAHPEVTVHRAEEAFTGDVSRLLVAAPTIGMHADGNQAIAIKYLVAASIPDSTGDYTWPATSPDLLTPDEVAGATTTSHNDGALFDSQGTPVYCQFMSMHWDVTEAAKHPETVAEIRSFLHNPVHLFAECQAVNAFENHANGHFLTTTGFTIDDKPASVDIYHFDQPFAQFDGTFAPQGGSEPSYTIPAGGAYKNGDVVMLTEHGSAVGIRDVWMTGFLDGVCPPSAEYCGSLGKVSYLGGHSFDNKTPISTNPNTQGTRLFLNSLFEAPCATASGQPHLYVNKAAPGSTADGQVTFTIEVSNAGPGVANKVTLDDPIPTQWQFLSATDAGTFSGGKVHWALPNLAAGHAKSVSFTIKLSAYGEALNTATLGYYVGLTPFTLQSNTTHTWYDKDTDGDGVVDPVDICPTVYDPLQSLASDSLTCGSCTTPCDLPHANALCAVGSCLISECVSGYYDCNGALGDGCEESSAQLQTDAANCGTCGTVCSFPSAEAVCVSGSCQIGACLSGQANCDGVASNGCEYNTAGFASDPAHCGSCDVHCGSGLVCVAGVCKVSTCAPGLSDCDGDGSNGCEYNNAGFQTDVNDCGSCSVVCALPHASASCVAGACVVGTCAQGWSNCNGLDSDGCEVDDTVFHTDPNQCGGCGLPCAPAHAVGICAAGACAVSYCVAGWQDCNGLAADGCEADESGFGADPANCGGCNRPCAVPHTSTTCVQGVCTVGTCDTGYWDLDQDLTNGCEYACTAISSGDTTCDAVDDDCNGKFDEGFVGASCGLGACMSFAKCVNGVQQCDPGPQSPEGPALDPSCEDGADNDCDGLTDLDDPDCTDLDGGAPDASDGSDDVSAQDGAGGTAQDAVAEDSNAAGGSAGMGGSAGTGGASGAGASAGSGGAAGAGASAGAGGTAGSGASAGTGASAGSGGTTHDSGSHTDTGAAGEGTSDTPATASGDDGGCGCRAAGNRSAGGWALVAAALGFAWTRRRNRARVITD